MCLYNRFAILHVLSEMLKKYKYLENEKSFNVK